MRLTILSSLAAAGFGAAFVGAVSGILPEANATLYFHPALACAGFALPRKFQRRTAGAIPSVFVALLLCDVGVIAYEKYVLEGWKYTYTATEPFQAPDPVLRSKLLPSVETRQSKRFLNGESVFEDVAYSIDAKGRRTTINDGTENAEAHALFLGCSFTFGMGVPTERTLPSAFARASGGGFRAYNYGVGGNGPSQMYMMLEQDELFDDVEPKHGVAIYSFIPDHLSRAAPYELSRILWISNSPLYRLNEAGELDGPFYAPDDAKLNMALERYRRWQRRSPLLRQVLRVRDWRYISERAAMDIVAKLAGESAKRYRQRFNGEFYVLIWPRMADRLGDPGYFVSALEANGVEVLRVPPYPDAAAARIHRMDEHPSAAEYEWVAARVYDALKERAGPTR